MRRSLVVVGVIGAMFLPAIPVANGACSTHWTQLADVGTFALEDLSAVDVSDAWAVGNVFDEVSNVTGFVASYDGTGWTPHAFPSPTASERLEGVGALASDDVWVVGDLDSPDGLEINSYIAHWDGNAFTRYPVDFGPLDGLDAVDGVASDDVWAVGNSYIDGKGRSLAVHWNGSSWTEVPTPRPPGARRLLFDVAAISSNDVWAVGSSFRAGIERPLALHWNGFGWRTVPLPATTGQTELTGVSGHRHRRLWAVGSTGDLKTTLTMRWDGSAWTTVPSPNPSAERNVLRDVLDVVGTQAWAVGEKNRVPKPLLLHWNGTAWRSVFLGAESQALFAIDGGQDGSMMIGGERLGLDGNGIAFQRCPAP